MKLVGHDLRLPFFLTGGTALSRFYLNHRFSDDLDFFINDDEKFGDYVEVIYDAIQRQSEWHLVGAQTVRTPAFVRLVIRKNEAALQNDFVNDIPYRVGKPDNTLAPCLIDTWQNILSNKIAAATRFAVKDMVDIVFLARRYSFHWTEILEHAKEKTGGVQAETVAQIIAGMPEIELEKIHWVARPNFTNIIYDLKKIAEDLVYGRDNSVCR